MNIITATATSAAMKDIHELAAEIAQRSRVILSNRSFMTSSSHSQVFENSNTNPPSSSALSLSALIDPALHQSRLKIEKQQQILRHDAPEASFDSLNTPPPVSLALQDGNNSSRDHDQLTLSRASHMSGPIQPSAVKSVYVLSPRSSLMKSSFAPSSSSLANAATVGMNQSAHLQQTSSSFISASAVSASVRDLSNRIAQLQNRISLGSNSSSSL
jgi:hypothetical protein